MTNPAVTLSTWGALGHGLAGLGQRRCDWKCVGLLVDRAKEKLAAEADRLQRVLARSDEELRPLSDPFRLDLGLHRWLAEDREEAYSDWLQWTVKEARTPARAFQLFGQQCPSDLSDSDASSLACDREVFVHKGHVGRTGRLDLFVGYRGVPRLVIEVKTTDADVSDTEKHKGYSESLRDVAADNAVKVLLAVGGQQEEYDEFLLYRWRDFCVEARRLARRLIAEDRVMVAAQTLAFVSAVEQNLLGFSAATVRGVCSGHMAMFNASLIDHLENSLR